MPTTDSTTARDAALLALRPAIDGLPAYETPQTVGDFLHHTLRPLLKLQNTPLLLTFTDYVQDHHIPLAQRSATEQQRLLTDLLARNVKLRYTLVGLIAALFTKEEMAFYRQHRAELNRRLIEMATHRLLDQLPALNPSAIG
ncbi:hypothetical protein [Hymenobacter sp. DG25A]|uniref:hypothetical protein n=1 Tax=Hymenobacter sp. DG25A TaxID=1385663 RepID=UPI000AB20479|nr:hypothetical protein [Hymenobacter sp. DG25A]